MKINFNLLESRSYQSLLKNLKRRQIFFLFLFSEDLLQTITNQSNLKSIQDNIKKPANISKQDIKQFFGMVIFLSIVKLPTSRYYWNKLQIYETTIGLNGWKTDKNDNFVAKKLIQSVENVWFSYVTTTNETVYRHFMIKIIVTLLTDNF